MDGRIKAPHWAAGAYRPAPALAARFRLRAGLAGGGLLRLELALMLLTLAAAAWLSATPIPQPELDRADIAAPQAETSLGDLSLSAAIIPGGPGVNSYDLVLKRAEAPATDVDVYIQLVDPQRDIRSAWQMAEQAQDGLYVSAGDEIDRAGETTLPTVHPPHPDSDPRLQSRQPQLIHLVALLSIAGVLAAWSLGRVRRTLAALQLSLASLLIAGAAVAVSLGVMAAGALMLDERQREYTLTLHPPPAVVNSVLPDAASLARGQALYREHCLVWQGESADFRALRNRLASARDDFLYEAVASGCALSPCGAGLSVEARWDVVNYFGPLRRE